jgi:hypothetical protein
MADNQQQLLTANRSLWPLIVDHLCRACGGYEKPVAGFYSYGDSLWFISLTAVT